MLASPSTRRSTSTPHINGYERGQHHGPGLISLGMYLLSLEAPASAAKVWRPLRDQVYLPLMPFFADGELPDSSFTALAMALPSNIRQDVRAAGVEGCEAPSGTKCRPLGFCSA